MDTEKQLDILLICNKPDSGNDANTIVDHIEAFEKFSQHRLWIYSNFGELSTKLDLNRFDVIIIHYSICLLTDNYLSRQSKEAIQQFNGVKLVFIQDEYRQINKMIEELNFLNIDLLYTCFPESEFENIYPESKLPGVSKFNNLTGYIPKRLREINNQPKITDRKIHVGYRGRKLPFWYGELAFEKWNIVDKWQQYVPANRIRSDISYHEKDRIYGPDWNKFLSSCKATLGVESGASIMDFTGELEKSIDFYQLTHPNESFQEVQKKYLCQHEGKYKLNQISPRCFEAIALKTVLVLYEGEYSNILQPDRHYILLKKDFSNIEEVVQKLEDDDFLQKMADTAFNEIALNPDYSYETFIQRVDSSIEKCMTATNKFKNESPYTPAEFSEAIKCQSLKSRLFRFAYKKFQQLPYHLRLFIKAILRPQTTRKYLLYNFYKLVRPAKNKNQQETR